MSHLKGIARAKHQIEMIKTEYLPLLMSPFPRLNSDLSPRALEFEIDPTLEHPSVHFLSGHAYSLKELPNENYSPATTSTTLH